MTPRQPNMDSFVAMITNVMTFRANVSSITEVTGELTANRNLISDLCVSRPTQNCYNIIQSNLCLLERARRVPSTLMPAYDNSLENFPSLQTDFGCLSTDSKRRAEGHRNVSKPPGDEVLNVMLMGVTLSSKRNPGLELITDPASAIDLLGGLGPSDPVSTFLGATIPAASAPAGTGSISHVHAAPAWYSTSPAPNGERYYRKEGGLSFKCNETSRPGLLGRSAPNVGDQGRLIFERIAPQSDAKDAGTSPAGSSEDV
mmetsp:Transcript_13740/g.35071  ORF Transcript_13740/g.35071 Transcript_13740/m.35071 type:complete len:258 (+) Transcript_13740:206-979(+)